MNLIALTIMTLGMVCSAVTAFAGGAEGGGIGYCSWCHGEAGKGYATAPRLAGQRAPYIESQLLSFQKHTRAGRFMWHATVGLSTQTAHDIAVHFSTIHPIAAADGDTANARAGKTVYQDGVPDSNIAACAPCHGPNAEGLGKIPRLGGLSHGYLTARLAQWAHGNDTAGASPMPQIARQLRPDQINALASYLSFVK